MRALIMHPPVLPYGYTLHHRFQRIWEAAQYVRRFHPDTSVLDAGLLNTLKGRILAEFAKQYDAIAFYAEPQMLPDVIDLAERCRHISPATRTIVYGPAAACFPEQVRNPSFDAVGYRGDNEAQIRQFFDLVDGQDTRTGNISLRDGDTWREARDAPETIPPDQWAYPPLTEMPLDDIDRIYRMKGQPLTVAVTASRGCPYKCTFCATPAFEGRPDRRRPAAELAEFIAAHSRFRHWQLYSPTFTLDHRWCMDFFREMRSRKVDIHWKCTTRVDRLDECLVREMAAHGCHMVGIGVETLGPSLDLIRKEISRKEIAKAVRTLTANGIIAKAYVMLGLPGQSMDDVRETVSFLAGLGARVRPSLYSPQGETDPLAQESEEGGALPLIGRLDRKSYLSRHDHYGEFLRMAFGGESALSTGGAAAAEPG